MKPIRNGVRLVFIFAFMLWGFAGSFPFFMYIEKSGWWCLYLAFYIFTIMPISNLLDKSFMGFEV